MHICQRTILCFSGFFLTNNYIVEYEYEFVLSNLLNAGCSNKLAWLNVVMWCLDEGNWGEKQGVEIIPIYYVPLSSVYLKSNPEFSTLTGHPHVLYHAKDGLVVSAGTLYDNTQTVCRRLYELANNMSNIDKDI